MLKNTEIILALSLIVLSSIAALWIMWPALTDSLTVQNDARIHVWWMRQYSEPGLFAWDQLAQMMREKSWRNPGYLFLFKILAIWFDPVVLSTCLGITLLPLTVFLFFLAGSSLGGKFSGFISGAIYLSLSFQSWQTGLTVLDGLQRSFRDAIFALAVLGLARFSPFLIDRRMLEPNFIEDCRKHRSRIYLEPHNSEILTYIGENRRFASAEIPSEKILFQVGPMQLIKM